ncbi:MULTISPECIES: hypothetical protein [Chroococcidiopsis]|uniref:hypothetical protein n=1 Tax=Chroococcidiopsis TaxID=54298 RepID=UPI0002F8643A|nr:MULTISPECIES: hypothetical protein [Chroococcidiopsis]URD52136.1 hypothetical protein M5J74_09110 [Chroococcidiopsis sp. CCNUC1]
MANILVRNYYGRVNRTRRLSAGLQFDRYKQQSSLWGSSQSLVATKALSSTIHSNVHKYA